MPTLQVTSDFMATKLNVLAAMLFPQDTHLRESYFLRNYWSERTQMEGLHTLTSVELQNLLSASSGKELCDAAADGTRQGTVAGDLLALIYEQWRVNAKQPSLRKALIQYKKFALGQKYGDGQALKYSDMQLRTYFKAALPSAHLWGAYRLLKKIKDPERAFKTAFQPEGLPRLLGVAKELEDFATTFIPKGTKPAKPIISKQDMFLLPVETTPISLTFKML